MKSKTRPSKVDRGQEIDLAVQTGLKARDEFGEEDLLHRHLLAATSVLRPPHRWERTLSDLPLQNVVVHSSQFASFFTFHSCCCYLLRSLFPFKNFWHVCVLCRMFYAVCLFRVHVAPHVSPKSAPSICCNFLKSLHKNLVTLTTSIHI